MINVQGLKIYIFYGKKGNCKSLFQAKLAYHLIQTYKRQEKKFPDLPKRKLLINQSLNQQFYEENKDHIQYWTNPEQLYQVRDSDILWDEIGKDLPAGSYKDTPKELKQVFSHLRKRGNRLFANTQVYEDIDISFRRQVDHAFQLKKVFGNRDISASLPPPKFIYGLFRVTEFDPMYLEHEWDEMKREQQPKIKFWDSVLFWRNWHRIKRKWVELYDTTMELPPYMPDKLKEIVLICREGVNCTRPEKDGSPHKIVRHEIV